MTGCDGPEITDITDISFRPDLATSDVETGRRLAHAEAADMAKAF